MDNIEFAQLYELYQDFRMPRRFMRESKVERFTLAA